MNPDRRTRDPDEARRIYDELIARCVNWARSQESVRAVIQVGSRARVDHPADAWADVDLMLYLTEPGLYAQSMDWAQAIAPVWLIVPSRTAGGDSEVLVMFEGGYNVDFVFCPVNYLEWLRDHHHEDPAFQRGARVLFNRDGLTAGIRFDHTYVPGARRPSSTEFERICTMFWYISVYIARQIRRGDLWLAKIRDAQQKELLLRMLQWHAGVVSGWTRDTWHNGRFIQEWADARAFDEIGRIFGAYDAQSAGAALLATVSLFQRLARETAAALALDYPDETEKRIAALLDEALADGFQPL